MKTLRFFITDIFRNWLVRIIKQEVEFSLISNSTAYLWEECYSSKHYSQLWECTCIMSLHKASLDHTYRKSKFHWNSTRSSRGSWIAWLFCFKNLSNQWRMVVLQYGTPECWNAGMPECQNAGILKPGTQNY